MLEPPIRDRSQDVAPEVEIEAAWCPVHPDRRVHGVCRRCGSFYCARCGPLLDDRLCPPCRLRAAAEPAPFGGWLVLSLVGLVASPLLFLRWAIPRWSHGPTASSTVVVELLMTATLAGLSLATIPLFIRKHRSARVLMIALHGGQLASGLLVVLVGGFAPGANIPLIVARWLLSGLWVRYFAKSPHVRAVFVR